jgi:trk system potassium uptake protein
MYIVISGGGKVGLQLGRLLSGKGHTVALIEKKPEIVGRLADELPTGILLVEGDGCDLHVQEDAGTRRADVFVAVTGSDQDNLVACQLAKVRFGVKRALARVNSQKNEYTFNALGIEGISSTTVICNLIEKEMNVGDMFTLHILKKGRLSLVEIGLPESDCAVDGKKVSDLALPRHAVLVSIVRGDEVIIPHGDTVLEAGDRVIAVTPLDEEQALRLSLGGG